MYALCQENIAKEGTDECKRWRERWKSMGRHLHCTQELAGPVVTLTRWNTPLHITDERGALDTPLLPADPLVVPAERRE